MHKHWESPLKHVVKDARSSTETGVWIKWAKEEFEPNEKQQNADNGPEVLLPVDKYTRPWGRMS